MNKKRKTIIKIFKEIGFSINIQTDLKVKDFLDVTLLNLQNGTYHPYKKPKNKLLYIHSCIVKPSIKHKSSSNSYKIRCYCTFVPPSYCYWWLIMKKHFWKLYRSPNPNPRGGYESAIAPKILCLKDCQKILQQINF